MRCRHGLFPVILTLLLFGFAPRPAAADRWLQVGAGMGFYSSRLYVRDVQGRFFQTLTQSTLGLASVKFQGTGWDLEGVAGLSDWPVSGEWRGTGFEATGGDYFLWSKQKNYTLQATFDVYDQIHVGLAYDYHWFYHFDPDTQAPYLEYTTRTTRLFAGYQFDFTPDVYLRVQAGYAPWNTLDAAQQTHVPAAGLTDYTLSVSGYEVSTRLEFAYQDVQGWGLTISWDLGWSQYQPIAPVQDLRLIRGRFDGRVFYSF
jgi:hypothetical protein